MKRIYLFLFTLIFFIIIQSHIVVKSEPNKISSTSYGGEYLDYFDKVIKTNDGGFLVVGSTDVFEGERIQFKGYQSTIVIKLDQNLNIEWKKILDDHITIIAGVTELIDGHYLLVGNTYITTIVLKLDSQGTIIDEQKKDWNVDDTYYLRYFDVSSTKDKGYIISAYINQTNQEVINFIKFNETGEIEWTSNINEDLYEFNLFYDIIEIKDGYIASGIGTKCEINKNDQKRYCKNTNLIVNLNESGQVNWLKENEYRVTDLVPTKDGHVAFIGNHHEVNEELSGYFKLTSNQYYGSYATITKLDVKNGKTVWSNSFGGSKTVDYHYTAVTEDDDGNFIAVGFMSQNNFVGINFQKNIGFNYIYEDMHDIIIERVKTESIMIKYDKNGNELWQSSVDGDVVLSVASDDNHYVTVGFKRVTPEHQTWLSYFDAFYSKINEDSVPKLLIDKVDEQAIQRNNSWVIIRCILLYVGVTFVCIHLILIKLGIKFTMITEKQFESLLSYIEKERGYSIIKDHKGYYQVINFNKVIFKISSNTNIRMIKGYSNRVKIIIKIGIRYQDNLMFEL